MSTTDLWTIDKDWRGKCIYKFSNSWIFCPVTWDCLLTKYILPKERIESIKAYPIDSYLVWTGICMNENERNRRWRLLNSRINNSESMSDRVMWELTNGSVFDVKDIDFVHDCILDFIHNHLNGYHQNVLRRFLDVSHAICGIEKNKARYFVIHPNSCDDNVERWFCEDEKGKNKNLSLWEAPICEFTIIENRKITGWATNLQMCKKQELCE